MASKEISPLAASELTDAISTLSNGDSKMPSCSVLGQYTHTDGDGQMWVRFFGNSFDTPVQTSEITVMPGDIVNVSIADGYARIISNVNSPAATTSYLETTVVERVTTIEESVVKAEEEADRADKIARNTQAFAEALDESLDTVSETANSAQERADEVGTLLAQYEIDAGARMDAADILIAQAVSDASAASQAITDAETAIAQQDEDFADAIARINTTAAQAKTKADRADDVVDKIEAALDADDTEIQDRLEDVAAYADKAGVALAGFEGTVSGAISAVDDKATNARNQAATANQNLGYLLAGLEISSSQIQQDAADIIDNLEQAAQDASAAQTLAETASKLGSRYATSGSYAATTPKIATITPNSKNWTPAVGARVSVKFTNGLTVDNPQLTVRGSSSSTEVTTAAIVDESGTAITADSPTKWKAGETVEFTWDGTNWILNGSSSKLYTSAQVTVLDNAITQEVSARSSGDTSTLNSAKSYADGKASAAQTNAVAEARTLVEQTAAAITTQFHDFIATGPNMLLDTDVNTYSAVDAEYPRGHDTRTGVTTEFYEPTQLPVAGIQYAHRWVITAEAATGWMWYAFYNRVTSPETAQHGFSLKKGEKYTVGCWVYANYGGRAQGRIRIYSNTDDGATASATIADKTFSIKYGWNFVRASGECPEARTYRAMFGVNPQGQAVNVSMADFILVTGIPSGEYDTMIRESSLGIEVGKVDLDGEYLQAHTLVGTEGFYIIGNESSPKTYGFFTATSARVGEPDAKHLDLNTTGIELFDGSTSLGLWNGSAVRLGKTNAMRIFIGTMNQSSGSSSDVAGIWFVNADGTVRGSFNGNDAVFGRLDRRHLVQNTNGMFIFTPPASGESDSSAYGGNLAAAFTTEGIRIGGKKDGEFSAFVGTDSFTIRQSYYIQSSDSWNYRAYTLISPTAMRIGREASGTYNFLVSANSDGTGVGAFLRKYQTAYLSLTVIDNNTTVVVGRTDKANVSINESNIAFYDGSGNNLGLWNGTSMRLGKSTGAHITLGVKSNNVPVIRLYGYSSGSEVELTTIASDSISIGQSGSARLIADSTGMYLYDQSGAVRTSLTSTGALFGNSSGYNLLVDANGLNIRQSNTSHINLSVSTVSGVSVSAIRIGPADTGHVTVASNGNNAGLAVFGNNGTEIAHLYGVYNTSQNKMVPNFQLGPASGAPKLIMDGAAIGLYDADGVRKGYFAGDVARIGVSTVAGNTYMNVTSSGILMREAYYPEGSTTLSYRTLTQISPSVIELGRHNGTANDPTYNLIAGALDASHSGVYLRKNTDVYLSLSTGTDGTAVTVGNALEMHTTMEPDGFRVVDGSNNIRSLWTGLGARLGRAAGPHVLVGYLAPNSGEIATDSTAEGVKAGLFIMDADVVKASLTNVGMTVGQYNNDHVVVTNSGIFMFDAQESSVSASDTNCIGYFTGTAARLGKPGSGHFTVTSSNAQFYSSDGTSLAYFGIDGSTPKSRIGPTTGYCVRVLGDGIYMQSYENNAQVVMTSIKPAEITLGKTTGKHALLNTTGLQLKDSSTVFTDIRPASITLGPTTGNYATINSTGLKLYEGSARTLWVSSDEIVLGSNASGKANIYISTDSSDATNSQIRFRAGTTVMARIKPFDIRFGEQVNDDNATATIQLLTCLQIQSSKQTSEYDSETTEWTSTLSSLKSPGNVYLKSGKATTSTFDKTRQAICGLVNGGGYNAEKGAHAFLSAGPTGTYTQQDTAKITVSSGLRASSSARLVDPEITIKLGNRYGNMEDWVEEQYYVTSSTDIKYVIKWASGLIEIYRRLVTSKNITSSKGGLYMNTTTYNLGLAAYDMEEIFLVEASVVSPDDYSLSGTSSHVFGATVLGWNEDLTSVKTTIWCNESLSGKSLWLEHHVIGYSSGVNSI